jgi:hypothetical protein
LKRDITKIELNPLSSILYPGSCIIIKHTSLKIYKIDA